MPIHWFESIGSRSANLEPGEGRQQDAAHLTNGSFATRFVVRMDGYVEVIRSDPVDRSGHSLVILEPGPDHRAIT